MAKPTKKKTTQSAATAKSETEVKKKRGTNTRKNVQDKPKFKTPTVLRIKLPKSNAETIAETTEKVSPKKKNKLLATEAQIEKANEVLKTIFIKKTTASPIIEVSSESNSTKVNVKQPLKKKKTPNVTTKAGPKKRGCKKAVATKPIANNVKQSAADCENVFVTVPPTPKTTKKSEQKVVKKDVIETVPPTPKTTKKSKQKVVKKVKSKPTIEPKLKKQNRKRKEIIVTTPVKKTNRRQLKKTIIVTDKQINKIATEIEKNITSTEVTKSVQQPLPNHELSDISRRTSMSSNCLSWTKDISSSSTTTCLTVRSDDFFRIDKKIPVLELNKVDTPCSPSCSSSDSDSSSSSSSSSSDSVAISPDNPTPILNGQSPNLSISPMSKEAPETSLKQARKFTNDMDTFKKALKALDKVKLMMNSLNLEILNWIGDPNENNKTDPKMNKIIDQLKQENDIVRLCQQFEDKISNTEIVESTNYYNNTKHDLDKVSSIYTEDDSPSVNEDSYRDKDGYREESGFRDNAAYTQDYADEDDDAISLFAEGSISCGESYRHSVVSSIGGTNNNPNEEYIPLPITDQVAHTASYQPSKIVSNYQEENVDKQRNDIFKLPNSVQKAISQQLCKQSEELKCNVGNNQTNRPLLMATVFGQNVGPRKMKSFVFKDVCFFNLISQCRREQCGFPHVKLEVQEVKNRIKRLGEDVFIREYMMIRHWPILRRTYGMCYVEECSRRELTNILIEMAIDFSKNANKVSAEDVSLSIAVLETALLHLNNVDLNTCKDLLNYNVTQRCLLCDVFMTTIAMTQNFSRFKLVFINLTNFIVQQKKTFSQRVADNIVERLSILPIDVPLAKALITILRNTDAVVLQNPRLSIFESQLLPLDKSLYEELQHLKLQVLAPKASVNPLTTHGSSEAEGMGQEMYTSETSIQESPNQMPGNTTPTKQIPQIFTVTNNYDESNYRQSNEQTYRHHFKPPIYRMRPPMLRGVKRRFDQRSIRFDGQVPKYQRRF